MSRNLINVPIIAALMAAGFRGSRCAEELKPCRANVWSPFHTKMSQHDQRNPPDLSQTALISVCVCSRKWGVALVYDMDLEILRYSAIFPIPVF